MFLDQSRKRTVVSKICSVLVAAIFSVSLVFAPTAGLAQTGIQTPLNLPAPGTIMPTKGTFVPVIMKGINVAPDNPFAINFIFDGGDQELSEKAFEEEASKVIRYFLTSLTLPKDKLWVNLSPYERERIAPEIFSQTEMGRDLLAQDYILKQFTASLMNPKTGLGQRFWKRINGLVQERYGTTEIPFSSFNKIWIVPQEAQIFEHSNGAFVVDSHLKVMLEQDYLALVKNNRGNFRGGSEMSDISSEIVRDFVIPAIEKEVNEGKLFANLRQVYDALLLATWYKESLKAENIGQNYFDQAKLAGVELEDKKVAEKIFDQYVNSFRSGAYDVIVEQPNPQTREIIPRKFFSGGLALDRGLINTEVPDIVAQRAFRGVKQPFSVFTLLEAFSYGGSPKGAVGETSVPEAPSILAAPFVADLAQGESQQAVAESTFPLRVTLVAANAADVVPENVVRQALEGQATRPAPFIHVQNISTRPVKLGEFGIGKRERGADLINDFTDGREVVLAPGGEFRIYFSNNVAEQDREISESAIVIPYELNANGDEVSLFAPGQLQDAPVLVAVFGAQAPDQIAFFDTDRRVVGIVEGRSVLTNRDFVPVLNAVSQDVADLVEVPQGAVADYQAAQEDLEDALEVPATVVQQRSAAQTQEEPGGIDLNPDIGSIKVGKKDSGFKWNFEGDIKPLEGISLDGLLHNIITITPIPIQNIPLQLGIVTGNVSEQLSLLR